LLALSFHKGILYSGSFAKYAVVFLGYLALAAQFYMQRLVLSARWVVGILN